MHIFREVEKRSEKEHCRYNKCSYYTIEVIVHISEMLLSG